MVVCPSALASSTALLSASACSVNNVRCRNIYGDGGDDDDNDDDAADDDDADGNDDDDDEGGWWW